LAQAAVAYPFALHRKSKMKVNKMFPSRFFRAADMDDKNPIVVTIAAVTMERVGQNAAELKPVMSFSDAASKLVLNKVNTEKLVQLFGDDNSDGWIGEQIALVHGTASFGGRTVGAVRVVAA
jgi:hypothetical protein